MGFCPFRLLQIPQPIPPPPFTLTLLSSLICRGSKQHTDIAPDKASCFLVSSTFELSLSFCVVSSFHSSSLICIVAVIACAVLHQCSPPTPLTPSLVLKLIVPPSGEEEKEKHKMNHQNDFKTLTSKG